MSDLGSKSQEIQVSTLVYCMGDKAEDILESFSLSAEDLKNYETVKGKFETYFIKKQNKIYERAKFNRRKHETVDDFITDLYCLAANCGYGTLHDELVRDKIVVGIKDSELAEKLQLEADLTLEQAVTKARQSESVKKQQDVVRGEMSAPLEAVHKHRQKPPKPTKGMTTRTPPKPLSCSRCGRIPLHSRQVCPANEAKWDMCWHKGHFKHCCRTKHIREVAQTTDQTDDSQEELEVEFMGTITTDAVSTSTPWRVTIKLNSQDQEFKIDTGADVSESAYSEERDGKLQPSQTPLTGPTGKHLEVCGKIKAHLYLLTNKAKTQQELYIVQNLQRALLGRPTIEALRVVTRIEPISETDIVNRFPEVFKGLGKVEGSYEIKLKKEATPCIRPNHTQKSGHTPVTKSEGRAQENGEPGGNYEDGRTNGLVRRNSSRTKVEWEG